MPAPRLIFAFALSLLLHLAVLAGGDWLARLRRAPPSRPTPAVLDVKLMPATPATSPLLKDTLAEAERQAKSEPPPPPSPKLGKPRPSHQAEAAAQRKLAEHLYYPEEAVARGLEGEVRLLLTLDAAGRIEDAQLAASSGHAILDQAALRAAWAMGRLDGESRRELILPVVFRLQP